MSTWRAQTTAPAPPEEVLEVLTHPAALARWSPVGFEIEELTTTRLCSGTHARVTGCLAGRQVKFDVDVMQADPERLLLHACGPVGLDVEYTITPAPHGSAIDVTITLRGQRGITKAVIARALHLLLAVGGLEVALARLVREVEDHDQRPTPPRRRPRLDVDAGPSAGGQTERLRILRSTAGPEFHRRDGSSLRWHVLDRVRSGACLSSCNKEAP